MPTQKWSLDFLEKKRLVADAVADQVVASIIHQNEAKTVSEIFRQMVYNQDINNPHLPTEVQQYFQTTAVLPSWANPQQIKTAEKIFWSYGREMLLLLLCKSLPTCYACHKGAEVLARTGRLTLKEYNPSPYTRRLIETLQFLINVMYEGGLSAQGKGITTAQKIRLMHATIRYFLKQQNWNTAEMGEPINQEDLAITMLSFSTYIIEGLEKVGIKLTPEEQEAYLHTWKVVGHLMGIEADMLPENIADATDLGTAILAHQGKYSEAGNILTQSCIEFLENIIPGNRIDGLASLTFRYLLGDSLADTLQIKHSTALNEKLLAAFMKISLGIDQRLQLKSEHFQFLFKHLNHLLLQGLVNYFNDYKQIYFYLPPNLTDNYPEKIVWKDVAASPSVAGYRLSVQRKDNDLK